MFASVAQPYLVIVPAKEGITYAGYPVSDIVTFLIGNLHGNIEQHQI